MDLPAAAIRLPFTGGAIGANGCSHVVVEFASLAQLAVRVRSFGRCVSATPAISAFALSEPIVELTDSAVLAGSRTAAGQQAVELARRARLACILSVRLKAGVAQTPRDVRGVLARGGRVGVARRTDAVAGAV